MSLINLNELRLKLEELGLFYDQKTILGPLPEALIKSREKLSILVLDEFDKTRPSAGALLLDFLQNCRVSVRISNEDKVIRGNPENLIVFLTSNEEREFSEPLLRRVIVINIPPLPTVTVFNIMLKYFDEKTAGVEIERYLQPFVDLLIVYYRSLDYLPTLRARKVLVVPFGEDEIPEGVLGFARRDEDNPSVVYVGFREHPPDDTTLAHELIHAAGGEELPAYNYSVFLLYTIEKRLPPFDLLELLRVDLATVERVLKRLGFGGLEDYFTVVGVIPSDIAELDLVEWRVRLRRDVPEHVVVQTFLAEIAGGLGVMLELGHVEGCLECVVFEEIAKEIAGRMQ